MLLRHHYAIKWVHAVVALTAGFMFVAIAGCQSATPTPETDQEASMVEATSTSRPGRTPTARITPTVIPTGTPEDTPITLTFWTVEEVSPLAEEGSGNFINSSLRAFERSNPDIEVELLVKKAGGKGGTLDFLRTAQEAAPSILPDVVVLNATDLTQAYSEDLLQPLDGRLDRSIVQDLLPAARRIGTVDDRLAGVPLGIEMEHTVYNTRIFTNTSVSWTDVLSKNTRYLFPAKGVNGLVNDATLAQYFSTGGGFLDDEGSPKIDDRVLKEVLDFYHKALETGTIDASILEASTTEELWPIYLEAQAGVAQISVRQYLTDRELLSSTAYGSLPVQDQTNTPVSVMHSWVLVLTTDDVNRQDAALRLIETFLSTSNNATWNSINKSIPTRDTAYRQLAGDDEYWIFLTEQLNTAQPEPHFSGYDRVGRIIQQAIEQVISGEATPEEATATAIDALAQ